VLTPSGAGDNEQCTTAAVKLRNGHAVIDEKLSLYVDVYYAFHTLAVILCMQFLL